MEILKQLSDSERPLLLDGGMGSLLIASGLARGEPPEAWNLNHPDRVESAHRAYVEAGSDVVHTNTFGGTAPKLASRHFDDRVVEVNAAGVKLARSAGRSDTLVAGDVGPTGLLFPPMGDTNEIALRELFRVQVRALADAGADLISIETMYDLREARAALDAALETSLPVFTSMTFDRKKRGVFTIVGDPMVSALSALAKAGATAVGLNCSVTSDVMVGMVAELADNLQVPLVVQPNAGSPRATSSGVVYDLDRPAFVDDIHTMIRAGAQIVAGCCGTDPETISMLRASIDAAWPVNGDG